MHACMPKEVEERLIVNTHKDQECVIKVADHPKIWRDKVTVPFRRSKTWTIKAQDKI